MPFLHRRTGFEASNKWRDLAFGGDPTLTTRHLSLAACLIQQADTEHKANVNPKGILLIQIPLYLGKEILEAMVLSNQGMIASFGAFII
jgi:hypothetical protein